MKASHERFNRAACYPGRIGAMVPVVIAVKVSLGFFYST